MKRIETIRDAGLVSANRNIPLSEVVFVELNRAGVWLPKDQVPIGFRARFLCNDRFSSKLPFYFAVPVKKMEETRFLVDMDDHLMFDSYELGSVTELEIDTCDCSYFRKGKKVLNLNSNQRGNCKGCTFCIHNYSIYDERVLKDRQRISGKEAIRGFFETEIIARNGWNDLSGLEQIAIVTGLFPDEKSVTQHIGDVRQVASEFGFNGPIFFLGSELRSLPALREVNNYGPFSFCYALDCLTNREQRLTKRKKNYSVSQIIQTLEWALADGFETTFSYIVGLDSLEEMSKGINELSKYVNRFPIVNIYQTQAPEQKRIMIPEAHSLDYYLLARKFFEVAFSKNGLSPHNWENYRSLWYHYFNGEYVPE